MIRLNLLNRLLPTKSDSSAPSQDDDLYANADETYQRVKTLPHCVQNCR